MKNYKNYIVFFLAVLTVVITGCQKDDYEIGEIIVPADLKVTYQIVGADDENPYGDGSGLVNFTVYADNAISYYIEFNDGKDKTVTPSGSASHLFSNLGVNTYNVTAYAVGTGGVTTSKTVSIEVLSTFSDEEAVQFLTGGDTKTWYWAADQTGHLGLGPNSTEYEPGGHTWPAWYQAGPWEKIESTLYDCELVFTLNDDDVNFVQINPFGEAFIQGLYASELGLGEEGSHPFSIEGTKNVSFSPSESIATIDGEYRGTSMTFSDGGFMGFYAGTSEYEIIEITENLLRVRMVQANEPLFAWYHIFTSEKPER